MKVLIAAVLKLLALLGLFGIFVFASVRGCVAEGNKERDFQICLQTCDTSPRIGTCVSVCWGRYRGNSND